MENVSNGIYYEILYKKIDEILMKDRGDLKSITAHVHRKFYIGLIRDFESRMFSNHRFNSQSENFITLHFYGVEVKVVVNEFVEQFEIAFENKGDDEIHYLDSWGENYKLEIIPNEPLDRSTTVRMNLISYEGVERYFKRTNSLTHSERMMKKRREFLIAKGIEYKIFETDEEFILVINKETIYKYIFSKGVNTDTIKEAGLKALEILRDKRASVERQRALESMIKHFSEHLNINQSSR